MDPNLFGPEAHNWLLEMISRDRNSHFQLEVDSASQMVSRACRDDFALQDARRLIPAQLLEHNSDADRLDKLLPELVNWFANEFFSWFQPPECGKCQRSLEFATRSQNRESKTMETYICSNDNCDYTFEFIRHNDPAILLMTRTGRCGEWANCFMTILRAVGYETRMILDSTDHVWNEIWSESGKRWIHVDPCEAVIDTPLLYEVGWSKKLQYCIAYSQNEVLDVTKRYSVNFEETKTRRRACDETWLSRYLDSMTEKLLATVDDEVRRAVLERRNIDKTHLNQLASKPREDIPDMSQIGGRKTGSIAWRIQRGEYSTIMNTHSVIEAAMRTGEKEDDKLFFFRYNCDKNTYTSSNQTYNDKKGWSSAIYSSENLDFKYERDWKTSYIARYETCPHDQVGVVVWRFNLSAINDWNCISIEIRGKVYPGTRIDLSLISYEQIDGKILDDVDLHLNETNVLSRDLFNPGAKFFDLTARLSGGSSDDSVAWQKPQLFRQTRGENSNEWSLMFELH